jgi:hypothetical protein
MPILSRAFVFDCGTVANRTAIGAPCWPAVFAYCISFPYSPALREIKLRCYQGGSQRRRMQPYDKVNAVLKDPCPGFDIGVNCYVGHIRTGFHQR